MKATTFIAAVLLVGFAIPLPHFISRAAVAGESITTDDASVAAGKRVYEHANCVGCHKWSGVGGGGYGGAALSLRKTELSRDDIVTTVTCGRPGTGMPHFTPDPYGERKCYGLTKDDVKDMMPPAANVILHQDDIEAVASYVITQIKGKGDPTLADCQAFFGTQSRVCGIYQTGGASGPAADAGSAPSHHALPTPVTTGH
jgi:Cytochrome C oxidase, cbb3-type, subunit III